MSYRKRLNRQESGLSPRDWQTLRRLNTPAKIQDFITKLEFNIESDNIIHRSPKEVLKRKRAHCFEGALLAATALWIQGEKPFLLDLVAEDNDDDHVVALYRRNGHWGAISKTNHAVLRYREPIYRSVRELVLSYFHEYFLKNGEKTLRRYSKPFDLSRLGTSWIAADDDLAPIAEKLDDSPHIDLLTTTQEKELRPADEIERRVMETTEYL